MILAGWSRFWTCSWWPWWTWLQVALVDLLLEALVESHLLAQGVDRQALEALVDAGGGAVVVAEHQTHRQVVCTSTVDDFVCGLLRY